jgi:hypothetical protein
MIKITLTMFVFVCSSAFAWDNNVTHMDLSGYSANLSAIDSKLLDQSITYNGQTKKALFWIEEGAKLEDAGSFTTFSRARFRNHFHNPLVNLMPPIGTLTDGGLTDKMTGQSTLFWAQDGTNQLNHEGGDWSWKTVRDHYYRSLTTASKVGMDMFTAMTYQGLGYQMHLVQDMAQPDHVRNDAHPIDGTGKFNFFETWAKAHYPVIRRYAATATKPVVDLTQPLYDGFAPVGRLMDTRSYVAVRMPSAAMNQGLAEYTNANFFSDDTIFAARYATDNKHYFPYPRKEGTDVQSYFDGTKAPEAMISEDGKIVAGLWISKTGEGETVPHLARVGAAAELAYAVFGEGNLFYAALGRDEIIYDDYARLLVPRAVGYSAALLDYFFRGKLTATVAPGDITFRSVKVNISNATINETMTTGDVSLVIRYKTLPETDLGGGKFKLNYPSADFTYKVITLPDKVDMSTPQTLTFDFGDDPLPINFSDMTMQLVFKGKLGNEEGAVAVSKLEPITGIYTDFTLSLPSSGVYAKTSDSSPTATFNELKVTARTDIPGGLTGGSFELALKYRKAATDPFQSVPVDTEPANAAAYLIRVAEKYGVSILQPGTPVELAFDLSSSLLPVSATDVYLNIIYKSSGTSKTMAVGVKDVSEPTPVDVFNNTDRVCIGNQWYVSGSPEAYAAVGVDNYGDPLDDIFSHRMDNVYFWTAGSGTLSFPLDPEAKNLVISGANPGEVTRLGYILTNYTSDFAFDEQVTALDSRDDWEMIYDNLIYPGTGFTNQADRGFSGMYTIRGKKMWWGTSVIYDLNADSDSLCGLEKLQ